MITAISLTAAHAAAQTAIHALASMRTFVASVRVGATSVLAGPFGNNPKAVPGLGKFQTVIGYTCWLASALCLIGLIVAGAMMAVSYQRGSNEHVGRLGGVAAGCLIVGGAASIVGGLLGFSLFTSNPQAVPGLSGVQTVISYVSWIAAGLCLIGLTIAGAMLAVSYQRGGNEHVGRLGGVAAGCLIVGGAASVVGALI